MREDRRDRTKRILLVLMVSGLVIAFAGLFWGLRLRWYPYSSHREWAWYTSLETKELMRHIGDELKRFHRLHGRFPAALSDQLEVKSDVESLELKEISCEDPFCRDLRLPLGYVTDSTAQMCILVSRGPDGKFQTDCLYLQKILTKIDAIQYELHYDPTNGSVSGGDLFMYCRGEAFSQ